MKVEFDSKKFQKVRLTKNEKLHVVSLVKNPDFFSFKSSDKVEIYPIDEWGDIAYDSILTCRKDDLKTEGALVNT
jgi:hypothetical protein